MESGLGERVRADPNPQVGSATGRGLFGGGFYFSPSCVVSLGYAQQHASGRDMLVVKVLVSGVKQGITLLHMSALRKRVWWDKGDAGAGMGVIQAGLEGVFRRLVDVLSVRNGLG